MDEYFGGYVISFNSKNDVRILDYNKLIPLTDKELRKIQATSLNAMIIRMFYLMRPYWKEEFLSRLANIDDFLEKGEFDLWNVSEPEEVQEYKKGFAYRCQIDKDHTLKSNNQAWGFGMLGKEIEEYSIYACIYVICYLMLSNDKSSYKGALRMMISDLSSYITRNPVGTSTEATQSFKIADKYFS